TPFFAGAKLPSRKVSSHRSSPSSSNPPSRARQASSQTPCSCHCCNRRQQVEGEGNSSGKNRQAAPVCRTHRIPSKQARFEAGGRPRLSRRLFGFENTPQPPPPLPPHNPFRLPSIKKPHPPPPPPLNFWERAQPFFKNTL